MAKEATAPQSAPTEAQLRELAVRGEALRQQLAALEDQAQLVAELVAEARRAHATLDHLQNAKLGEEILVPLGAGTFVHAQVADPTKALTSIGAGVHAQIPVAEAVARLQARITNLEQASEATSKDVARLSDEMARVAAVLEPYYG